MPKDDRVYVGHMLDNARKAEKLLGGRDRAAYDADETIRLALAYLLQVIGEAARRNSDDFRDQHPGIPWKAIDVIVDRDGTLLVLDFGTGTASARSGTLYRIVYTGG